MKLLEKLKKNHDKKFEYKRKVHNQYYTLLADMEDNPGHKSCFYEGKLYPEVSNKLIRKHYILIYNGETTTILKK